MEQALHLTNCKNNNPFSSYSNKTNSKPSQTKPLATILLDDNTSLITALWKELVQKKRDTDSIACLEK